VCSAGQAHIVCETWYVRFCGCVGVWVCGCVGVWVCGCVGVWVCGATVVVLCVRFACCVAGMLYVLEDHSENCEIRQSFSGI